MRICFIPTFRKEELLKRVKGLNAVAKKNKLPPLICTITGQTKFIEVEVETRHHFGDYRVKKEFVEFMEVIIEGESPIVSGYKFEAYIEKVGDELQFFPYSHEAKKPEAHELYCEHCKVKRDRKYYFQLQKDGKSIIVGKSCLKDFLGHISVESFLMKLNLFFFDLVEKGATPPRSSYTDYKEIIYKRVVACLFLGYENCMVDKELLNRYTVDVSSQPNDKTELIIYKQVVDFIRENKERIQEEYDRVIEYFSTPKDDNFENNIYLELKKTFVPARKDKSGLVGYAPISYYKLKMKRKERKEVRPSSFIGEVGQKMECELIYQGSMSFEGHYNNIQYLHKFADDSGNIFAWWTSVKISLEHDDRASMKFTIKEHKEYRGVPQTIITRAKILT